MEVYAVILVVASVMFATRYFQQQASSRLIRIEVTAKEWESGTEKNASGVPYWLSEKLVVGLTQRSLSGRITAEIINVENYAYVNNRAQIFLLIRVMADYNDKTQAYYFQGQPLLVGAPIEFKFDGVLVPGQVIDDNSPQNGYEFGEFMVTVKNKHLEPWIVDSLKVGQEIINRATGDQIAELLAVESMPTRSKQIFGFDRQLLTDSQNYQDATIKLKIKAVKQDGSWFFAGYQQVRLGNKLKLCFDDLTLSDAEIVKLEYVVQ